MHIAVTNEDLQWAKSQDRWNCAIVRAIQRENPDAVRVRVDTSQIAYTEGGHRYFYETPQLAIERVIKPFDQHREVKPISFDTGPATKVKQAQRMNEEDATRLRRRNRVARAKENETENPRTRKTHERFCDPE